ncbi:MAG: hypothetical protein HN737_06555 [Desulfobacterales bacterium]|nr:hypothetical protein [Desulfobacterales bacterium]
MHGLKKGVLISIVCLMVLIPISAMALQTTVGGHIESKVVIRDTDGLQYGFLSDYNEVVSFRHELKLDVLFQPEYKGLPALRLDKINLIYKGAYDAVFDLSDRYNNMPVNVDHSEFEVGKDDLRFENDLKEVYADFIYDTERSVTTLRLGRQLVIWGEHGAHNIANTVCPLDMKFAKLGANPEEFSQPLWMARFDHSMSGVGPFGQIGIQLLAIPEIRPVQWALGSDPNGPNEWWKAPYAPFGALHDWPLNVNEMQEVVPSSGLENMQFGAKLGLDIGKLHMDAYYFIGYQAAGAFDLSDVIAKIFSGVGSTLYIVHPKMENIAISGNYYSNYLRGVLDFEIGFNDNASFGHSRDSGLKGYSLHDVWQGAVSFSRPIRFLARCVGTRDTFNTTWGVYHRYISSYDDGTAANVFQPASAYQNNTALSADFSTYWDAGRIMGMASFEYDTEGVWYTMISAKIVRGNWYLMLMEMSVWGREDAYAAQKHVLFGLDEISLSVGYNF